MEVALIFVFIFMIGGFLVCMISIYEVFESEKNKISEDCVANTHNYSEEEYVALFNFCLGKADLQYTKITNCSAYNIEYQKYKKMEQLLEEIRAERHNPYKEANYSKLCLRLLTLLTEEEREEINYGILN